LIGASWLNRASVRSRMRLCWSASLGLPRVEPRGSRVKVALGGPASRVMPAFQLVSVVAIPFISNALAINPTDWQQLGQAGTNRAAVASPAVAASRIAGIVSSTNRVATGM
jgi:hypothetical protein